MKLKLLDRGVESLRQPDRLPRCYELTEDERSAIIKRWERQTVKYESESANISKAMLRENRHA